MAFESRRSDGCKPRNSSEFAMRHSPSSAVLYLPFGSLTGVIPVDAVQKGRMLGDFSSVFAGSGQHVSEIQQQIHSVIDPIPHVPRSRRPSARAGTAASD